MLITGLVAGILAGYEAHRSQGDSVKSLKCNECNYYLSVLELTEVCTDGDRDHQTPEDAEYICRNCKRYYKRRNASEGVESYGRTMMGKSVDQREFNEV
jgi:uncharacterized protein with PIN domain